MTGRDIGILLDTESSRVSIELVDCVGRGGGGRAIHSMTLGRGGLLNGKLTPNKTHRRLMNVLYNIRSGASQATYAPGFKVTTTHLPERLPHSEPPIFPRSLGALLLTLYVIQLLKGRASSPHGFLSGSGGPVAQFGPTGNVGKRHGVLWLVTKAARIVRLLCLRSEGEEEEEEEEEEEGKGWWVDGR
jgi:hypothetical protein